MKTINVKKTSILVALGSIIVSIPSVAYAYVDPGFLSSAYQAIYLLVFGAVAGVIFKPWNYLKDKFFSKKADSKTPEDTDK